MLYIKPEYFPHMTLTMSVVLAPMRTVPYIMTRTQTRSTSSTHSRQWTSLLPPRRNRKRRSASFGIAQRSRFLVQ